MIYAQYVFNGFQLKYTKDLKHINVTLRFPTNGTIMSINLFTQQRQQNYARISYKLQQTLVCTYGHMHIPAKRYAIE